MRFISQGRSLEIGLLKTYFTVAPALGTLTFTPLLHPWFNKFQSYYIGTYDLTLSVHFENDHIRSFIIQSQYWNIRLPSLTFVLLQCKWRLRLHLPIWISTLPVHLKCYIHYHFQFPHSVFKLQPFLLSGVFLKNTWRLLLGGAFLKYAWRLPLGRVFLKNNFFTAASSWDTLITSSTPHLSEE